MGKLTSGIINVYFDNLQVTHIRGPLVEENHYYPFGLIQKGISSSALGFGSPGNKSKYNGKEEQKKEFVDETGLDWLDFKFRFYDNQVARFFCQDALATKFTDLTPYQFCSNSPIWLKEIDGLEGIKYTEDDGKGSKRKVIEKNVVVLLEKKKDIPTNASEKKINKINNKNERIEKRNNNRMEMITEDLNTFYNGQDGKGSKNSDDEYVYFKFNVIGKEVKNTNPTGYGEIRQIGFENGIVSGDPGAYDGAPDEIAPAAVILSGGSGADHGVSGGVDIRFNDNAPRGIVSHEMGHQFQLKDNYGGGGVMDSPPQPPLPSEVSEMWKKSFNRKR